MFFFSTKYTLFCLLITFFLLFCNQLFPKNKKRGAFFVLVTLGIISAISCNFGSDSYVYYTIYNQILNYFSSFIGVLTFRFQNAMQALCYLVQKFIGGPYTIFFVISAIYVVLIWNIFKKYSKNPRISVIIWLLTGFFAISCNILKQYFAMLIMYYAFFSLQKRHYFRFLLLTILASMFHISAIFVSIIYILVDRIDFRNYHFKYIFTVTVLIAIFIVPIVRIIVQIPIFSKYSTYLGIFQNVQLRLMLGPLVNIIFYAGIIYILTRKNVALSFDMQIYLKMIIIGVCFSIIGLRFLYAGRIAYYFYLFAPLLIANGLCRQIITGKKKIYLEISLIVFCFMFTIFSGELSYFNYSTIFNDYPVPLKVFMSR